MYSGPNGSEMSKIEIMVNKFSSVALALSFGGIAVFLSGCSKGAEADPRLESPVVPVMEVRMDSIPEKSYTGIVKAKVESFLGFRVPGKIVDRLVDTGQSVRRGQLLYRLDRTDLIQGVKSRQESVSAQRGTVESKKSSVEAARAHMIQAEADEKRYRSAVAVGVATEQAYDQYKAAAASARAEFAAAQAEVQAAHDQVSALQAQERVSENESSYSELVADVDGVVTETLAEPGQVVAVGQTVVKIARKGAREAVVNLPETVRPALGSLAVAKVYDENVPKCETKLRQLSDSADPLTRTFEARYVLEGKAANAPLGSTVTVSISTAPTRSGANLSVPLTALIDKGQGPGVWLVDQSNSTVHFRAVKLATLGSEDAALASGLRKGEQFVAQGAHLLHENDKIRVAVASKDFVPAPLATPPHVSE